MNARSPFRSDGVSAGHRLADARLESVRGASLRGFKSLSFRQFQMVSTAGPSQVRPFAFSTRDVTVYVTRCVIKVGIPRSSGVSLSSRRSGVGRALSLSAVLCDEALLSQRSEVFAQVCWFEPGRCLELSDVQGVPSEREEDLGT